MKRLVLVLAAAVLLLPGAAHAAACSPLNCAPSQFTLAHGTLIAYRASSLGAVRVADLRTGEHLFTLPGGIVSGDVLVHRQGLSVEWYDATTGTKTQTVTLPWAIRLAGVSQDGTRAVGFRLTPDGATTIEIVSPDATREVVVPGRQWDFDALRGDKLFLIRYLSSGGYQVRLLDLGTGKLASQPLKDPHESGTIWGMPFSRLSSEDGRYLFTLYITSNGAAMVHELDLAAGKARCIDLPGTGDYGSAATWAMMLGPGGHTLWTASPGYGRVVAIDVATRKVRTTFRIQLPYWNVATGTRAAISPDGHEIALADGETVALVGLSKKKVVKRTAAQAAALGYSPTGQLWKLR
jgi:hypothetical protein